MHERVAASGLMVDKLMWHRRACHLVGVESVRQCMVAREQTWKQLPQFLEVVNS